MAQRRNQKKGMPFSQYRDKDDEHTKVVLYAKFYITPNRDSRPLRLPQFKSIQQSNKISPSFDNFNLSAMFDNKTLSPGDIFQFKQERRGIQIYETPQKIRLGIFPLQASTSQISKKYQGSLQAKKSRPKEKGLRKLSQRAYEIVLNMQSASYKEVANKLVDQLNNEKQLDQQVNAINTQGKDQQNIKRRVYDALNVLIALGVLRKEDRRIVGDRANRLKFSEEQFSILSKSLADRRQSYNKKLQNLKQLRVQHQIIQSLVERNRRTVETDCSKVHFPFLILLHNSEQRIISQPNGSQCQNVIVKWIKDMSDYQGMDLQALHKCKFLLNQEVC